jgi:hypothetical protein
MTPDPNVAEAYVKAAEPKDIAEVAQALRKEDIAEANACGLDAKEALYGSARQSDYVMAIMEGEQAVGIFGVGATNQTGTGCVWMVGTPGIERISYTFLRQSRGWVDAMNDKYPVLWNRVYAKNEVHIRWLKWLGFKIIGLGAWGPKQEPFYQFIRMK